MPHSKTEPPAAPAPYSSITPLRSMHVAFMGPHGFRAGWGIFLFLAGVFGLWFLGVAGVTAVTGRGPDMERGRYMILSHQLIPEIFKPASCLLVAYGISFLEQRYFGAYGLALKHVRDLLPGVLWGLFVVSIFMGLLYLFHLLAFDQCLLHGMAAFRSGGAWLLFYLVIALSEEFLFRGYVLFTLMRGVMRVSRRISSTHTRAVAFWISAIICSLLFFVSHLTNTGETASGLVGIFLFGILFSYALWRTGSLWWGIGFHMTWDWSQSFLYGVPDSGTFSVGRLFATRAIGNPLLSGGVDGPEGSLLLIPILLLAFLAIRLQPQAAQPPLESGLTQVPVRAGH